MRPRVPPLYPLKDEFPLPCCEACEATPCACPRPTASKRVALAGKVAVHLVRLAVAVTRDDEAVVLVEHAVTRVREAVRASRALETERLRRRSA